MRFYEMRITVASEIRRGPTLKKTHRCTAITIKQVFLPHNLAMSVVLLKYERQIKQNNRDMQ